MMHFPRTTLVGGLRPVRRRGGPGREPHLKREVMQDQAPLSLRLLLGTEQVTEPGQESGELHAAFKLAEFPQLFKSVGGVSGIGEQPLRGTYATVLPDHLRYRFGLYRG